MGEILGLGLTHFPPMTGLDAQLPGFLERLLKNPKIPESAKDPKSWPKLMQEEWADDRGVAASAEHRRRLVEATRATRRALDEFEPDFVVMWGDDQYENFREDIIPPFCVFALGEVACQPFNEQNERRQVNVWNEPKDKTFLVKGHRHGAKHLVTALMNEGFDMSYAYVPKFDLGLARAFINTLLYLDYDRDKGWPYPLVPFHVNCYGSNVIRAQGVAAHLAPGEVAEADPPGPTPARCFDLGAAVARAIKASRWRVALIASSSWSHAFLTEKTNYILPDMEADRRNFEHLKAARLTEWRKLTTAEIEGSGQHEFLNWVVLAGAMNELGMKPQIVDWIETYVFNSNKCFAIFKG
jgi:hypothetical protein